MLNELLNLLQNQYEDQDPSLEKVSLSKLKFSQNHNGKENLLLPFFTQSIQKGKVQLQVDEKATLFNLKEFFDFYNYVSKLVFKNFQEDRTTKEKPDYKLSDLLLLLTLKEKSFPYLKYWINTDLSLKETLLRVGMSDNEEEYVSSLKNIKKSVLDKELKTILNKGEYFFNFTLFVSTDETKQYSVFIRFQLSWQQNLYFDLSSDFIIVKNIQNVWNMNQNIKFTGYFDEINKGLMETLKMLKHDNLFYLVSKDFNKSLNNLKAKDYGGVVYFIEELDIYLNKLLKN